ncbi:14354_t:CDS:2 [Entrophospora sp. SA101]|nr:14354_t:CDS:2 [Entrophospora sp. SA101]
MNMKKEGVSRGSIDFTTSFNSGVEVIQNLSSIGTSLDATKQALGVVSAVSEAVKPFIPLISISQSEIDQKSLKEDLDGMTEFLDKIHGGIVDNNHQINTVLEEVLIIKGQMDSIDKNTPYNENPIKPAQISPAELGDTMYPKKGDRRGKPPYIFKKILKKAGSVDVACKVVSIPSEKEKPQDYQKMDKNYKSKIAKFDYARHTDGVTSDVKNITEVIHWLAPEKLRFGPRQRYNFKCEIFSFGMLLWELAFERVPYEKWDMSKVREYVLAGGRENIQFGEADDETKNLQEDYAKIIKGAWEDDPSIRSSLQFVFFQLNGLYSQYPPPVAGARLHPQKTIDFDGSLRGGKKPVSVSDEGSSKQLDVLFQSDKITQIMTLDDADAGIWLLANKKTHR